MGIAAVRRGVSLTFATVLAALATAPIASGASGGSAASSAAAWQLTGPLAAPAQSGVRPAVQPDRFQALTLDRAALEQVLADVPGSRVRGAPAGALTISLPTPAGTFERFAVQRSAVMAPALAARHPGISTFSGTGIDVPGSTVRLDIGSLGLHASVVGPEGAWYIDPAYNREQVAYVSYFGRDLTHNQHGSFRERGLVGANRQAGGAAQPQATLPPMVQLRTYRLALASDPSYADYFGAANVTSAKVALMDRVNQPYVNDLAVQMQLIGQNDKLNLNTDAQMVGKNGPCGTAACYSKPEVRFCSGATLVRTKTVIGQIVGAGKYDIGHLALGKNGGGIAALGVVGGRNKALGCTGVPTPQGDLYAIDYVAHEMGHEFGANHTFNGTQSNCGFGNRNGPTSVEPGSGSSIMAYAGICATDDLQPHSDAYFSERSIDEITDYVTSDRGSTSEVQSVALRKFDTKGDSFTLSYQGNTSDPIVRGKNYNAQTLEQQIEKIAGGDESVVGFGGTGEPSNQGFQVTFGGDLKNINVASLKVTDTNAMKGFVGEIVRGGPIDNGGNQVIETGNHRPAVNTPKKRKIPVRTPFSLTGSATDRDFDPLTYMWEQNDIGGGDGTPLIDNTKPDGPLFREFGTAAIVTPEGTLQSPSPGENIAGPDPTRTFPDMAQVVAGDTNAATGTCPKYNKKPPVPLPIVDCYSEFLPTDDWVGVNGDRTMHFRLTVRDGNPVAGGVAHSDTAVKIVRGAGPFLVTSQSTATTVDGGSSLTVTWDPANTSAPPINADRVTISLSLDDGNTFPVVLAADTRNDGSETVRLPNVDARHARIKVQAYQGIFFDINHADLKINATGPGG
jgi:reprolysin-like metallo-peptidase family M12B